MKHKLLFIISLIVIALVMAILRLPSFDFIQKETAFTYNGYNISGCLALPKDKEGPFPVAIFVHGDGEANKTGNDYYLYYWEKFTEAGIACFSWDKQGIGQSDGNWEHQDMEDRAKQVIAAIKHLKSMEEVIDDKIGLIGFSQAGWVMPYVSKLSDYPSFIISVSGAVNVFSQGDFYNTNRLLNEGFSMDEVNNYLSVNHKLFDLMDKGMSYQEYLVYWEKNIKRLETPGSGPMSQDRFIFSSKKWPDVRELLPEVRCPLLAIYGDRDLNVDVLESMSIYREILNKNKNEYQIELFNNGTHSLLRADRFQNKDIGLMDLLVHGESIFVEGYFDLLLQWLKENLVK